MPKAPDFGEGLSFNVPNMSELAVQYGVPSQVQRALSAGAYFLGGVFAINGSQLLGAPLSLINQDWYDAWIAMTKQSFGLLTTTMTQWWAPTIMRISGDTSVRGQLGQAEDGSFVCSFPERMVMVANHQIYTDWLYLWWLAYTNNMHGRLYIVLKESLRRLPVIGWGMQMNKFIFLKRNWEQDKPNLSRHLQGLNKLKEPMWLMLFPEGTNLAPSTRERSAKWAAKNGIRDFEHVLIPRATGLQFCLQELHKTTDYVYDCTVAYEGVPRGAYAQDIYTIKASYMEGRPPKSVNMYWRRFPISSIPINDDRKFEFWLRERWAEKDALIEGYYRNGRFPADTGVHKAPNGETKQGCGYIETEVKSAKWYEFLQVFAPVGVLAMILYMIYGTLPKDMTDAINAQGGAAKKMLSDSVDMYEVDKYAKAAMAHPMVDKFFHGEINPNSPVDQRRPLMPTATATNNNALKPKAATPKVLATPAKNKIAVSKPAAGQLGVSITPKPKPAAPSAPKKSVVANSSAARKPAAASAPAPAKKPAPSAPSAQTPLPAKSALPARPRAPKLNSTPSVSTVSAARKLPPRSVASSAPKLPKKAVPAKKLDGK